MTQTELPPTTFTRATSARTPVIPFPSVRPSVAGAARTAPSAPGTSFTLSSRLHSLYELSERADHVFGSPLGPFHHELDEFYLPRFVYFGPHTSQESVRLAILAGFGRHDRPLVEALLVLISQLAEGTDIGQSLNVSFYPVVNVIGLIGGEEERDLTHDHWGRSLQSEIVLLGRDAHRAGYQGFIRVISTADERPSAVVRTVTSKAATSSPVEVFSLADFQDWPVRFNRVLLTEVADGPLGLAGELPLAPFEVVLSVPADWSATRAAEALAPLLRRLIVRYRTFLAFGQHL